MSALERVEGLEGIEGGLDSGDHGLEEEVLAPGSGLAGETREVCLLYTSDAADE